MQGWRGLWRGVQRWLQAEAALGWAEKQGEQATRPCLPAADIGIKLRRRQQ